MRGLRAGYDGVEVLHDVSFDVEAGSIVAVLGPNGAGKTTLCSVITGLVAADAGTVRLGGEDVTKRPPHRRSQAGLVLAPESRGIFAGLTVEENLRLVLDAEQREFVYERFHALRERRKLPAGVLSGGEQQMLTLAPLLAKPPRVLVADEPSLGLAPLVIEQVMEILREIAATGCAVLLVEEKLHGIAHVAERVIALDLGQVAWTRAAADVDAAALAATYLGVDRELADRVEQCLTRSGSRCASWRLTRGTCATRGATSLTSRMGRLATTGKDAHWRSDEKYEEGARGRHRHGCGVVPGIGGLRKQQLEVWRIQHPEQQ